MIVGIFYFELYIPGVRSLKEKRSVLRSLKQRLRNGHNVSVSEVDFQDKHMRSGIGVSCVCMRQRDCDKTYDAVYQKIADSYPVTITMSQKDFC